jgi:2-C-methyl-D-erythritol 4-phosphate cytidylyltransferase
MGRPKQFLDLLGAPALAYTLRAFEASPSIDRICVVGDAKRVKEVVLEEGITKYAWCTDPGDARSLSTRNGLKTLDAGPEDLVLIHDGSRCLLTPDLIERVVAAANGRVDGVIPALPVSDTIKAVDGRVVRKTLDRSSLWAVQTPQAFRYGVLERVFESPEEVLARATDDASLIEDLGGRVEVVEGEKTNIKLTSPEDLIFAEAILRSHIRERA